MEKLKAEDGDQVSSSSISRPKNVISSESPERNIRDDDSNVAEISYWEQNEFNVRKIPSHRLILRILKGGKQVHRKPFSKREVISAVCW